jgi:hypothetical protein
MHRKIQIVCASLCAVFLAFALSPARAQQQANQAQQGNTAASNPLVDLLQSKGILTAADVASIQQAGSTEAANQKLTDILLQRGVISQSEHDRLTGQATPSVQAAAPAPPAPTSQPPIPAAQPQPSVAAKSQNIQAPPFPTEPGAPSVVERVPSNKINEALSPIRALPVGGLTANEHPAFKADGVGITPYGFIKATAVEDSSSPQGDDFPLPGFLTPTAANGDPEFHLKARATRFGASFDWYDRNPKWVITGKIELDFEGNFNRADNSNLSSIRSNNPRVRLAYGRLDYHYDANNTFSALFGQDWTLYGSSTLPNILETTGLGIDFGTLYERLPQMRVGYTHKAGGISIMPEFGINLPASGLTPVDVANQLGYAEQTGPNSNQPQVTGRLVVQGQLDHAKGVAPAQLIFSGFEGKTGSDVTADNISGTPNLPSTYAAAFPNGLNAKSKQDGWDVEWQLPTRWATLVGKFYSGSDLFFYFAGQLQSYYNDTKGLTNPVGIADTDGAAPLGGTASVVLGTNASGQVVVAPQRPVRSQGGFVELGLPLSRIFHADPAGRNAGWSLYATYAIDQAKRRDLNTEFVEGFGSPIQDRVSTMALGTLNYKLNRWVAFSFEESLLTTHCNPGTVCTFRNIPAREWNDIREEVGPIFTF